MSTSSKTETFSPDRFVERLRELGDQPRKPRLVDILLENRDVIVQRLREARYDKEIYDALSDAGYRVSYPGFQRAMKQFREVLKLPTRMQLRAKASQASRFTSNEHRPEVPEPRVVVSSPGPLTTQAVGRKGKMRAAIAGAAQRI